ncbi:MAG: FeoB-associated Cys-rich membrane protein [Phycisphaerae bacterium]
MIFETLIVGILIACAAGYLLRRVLRATLSRHGGCGGGAGCRCDGGSADRSDRLGKRHELIELGLRSREPGESSRRT